MRRPLLLRLFPALLLGLAVSIADAAPRAIPRHAVASLPKPAVTSSGRQPEEIPLHRALQEKDIREKERLLTNRILAFLPSFCSDALETFVVRYDPDAHRGLGGGSTIIVKGLRSSTFPSGIQQEEYVGIIAHECAHLFVSANRGTAASGVSKFRDGSLPIYNDSPLLPYFRLSWNSSESRHPGDTRSNHCSGYGYETDPHEDLSECFVLAALHERTFEERAAQNPVMAAKLRWIRKHMLSGFTPLRGSAWDGEVPWDTTKVPHEFFAVIAPPR